jgi:HPt (histidine-containing phosphotransfer) domain-containing protein
MQSLSPPLQFDPDRLLRLLELVGPTEAPALLSQLDQDLSDCARQIRTASGVPDWTVLREASHVLISLAGSTGAHALQAMAEALNAAAHARNSAALTGLLGQLEPDLARLIALVRAAPGNFAGQR